KRPSRLGVAVLHPTGRSSGLPRRSAEGQKEPPDIQRLRGRGTPLTCPPKPCRMTAFALIGHPVAVRPRNFENTAAVRRGCSILAGSRHTRLGFPELLEQPRGGRRGLLAGG